MVRKSWKVALSLIAVGIGLVACANQTTKEITVVTREAGSGTRDAFTELTGILLTTDGNKIDRTTKEAVVQNSTEGVLSTVAGNQNGIGYSSLGNLNQSVKAVQIDGVAATTETITDGSYAIQRPFTILWGEIDATTQDFITFILSKQGQQIVSDFGYVTANSTAVLYESFARTGKISIVGSTSVAPVMEKLIEAYRQLNPDVIIDLTANGSSAGVAAVKEETADLGMSSRTLTQQEADALNVAPLAIDGIVIIVHPTNPITSLTLEQVQAIFSGEVVDWDELAN